VLAGLLGLTALSVGMWASVGPHSFFTSFPGFGHHWVLAQPPYNEHLTRDVGGLYLALAVVSGWAVTRGTDESYAVSGLAWLVFGGPHLVFHWAHLGVFPTADQIGNLVALGVTVLAPVLLLAGPRARLRAGAEPRASRRGDTADSGVTAGGPAERAGAGTGMVDERAGRTQ
jgi:hypothetical protein